MNLIQQIAASLSSIAVCAIIQVAIWNWKYIVSELTLTPITVYHE